MVHFDPMKRSKREPRSIFNSLPFRGRINSILSVEIRVCGGAACTFNDWKRVRRGKNAGRRKKSASYLPRDSLLRPLLQRNGNSIIPTSSQRRIPRIFLRRTSKFHSCQIYPTRAGKGETLHALAEPELLLSRGINGEKKEERERERNIYLDETKMWI